MKGVKVPLGKQNFSVLFWGKGSFQKEYQIYSCENVENCDPPLLLYLWTGWSDLDGFWIDDVELGTPLNEYSHVAFNSGLMATSVTNGRTQIVKTYRHDHSLECSREALSDGAISSSIQFFCWGKIHFLNFARKPQSLTL
jgi:hypothetical protein